MTEIRDMKEPLVSIGMITYNHAAYIAQAIEGVIQQQTDFPFELVIGEDRSTDNTLEIIRGYQQQYPETIRLITSDRNVGMTENGRRTMKACRGKYVAFCEGDDYWHDPLKLRKQVDYLERHPECGLVFTDYDFHFSDGRTVREVNRAKGIDPEMNLTIEQALGKEGGAIRTCTVMGRRHLIEKVTGDDPYLHYSGHFLMGDVQLFAEMARVSQVSYYPESTATYRIHEESATRSRNPLKTARFCKSACEMKLYICRKHKLPESLQREMELDWCDHALRVALHSGDAELADEVRKKKKRFTAADWLRYYGARKPLLNSLLRASAALRNRLG